MGHLSHFPHGVLLYLQVRDNPVWFVAFVWCEVAIQLPFFFVAAYAYLRGTSAQALIHCPSTLATCDALLLNNSPTFHKLEAECVFMGCSLHGGSCLPESKLSPTG
jgi:hypothetical protein